MRGALGINSSRSEGNRTEQRERLSYEAITGASANLKGSSELGWLFGVVPD